MVGQLSELFMMNNYIILRHLTSFAYVGIRCSCLFFGTVYIVKTESEQTGSFCLRKSRVSGFVVINHSCTIRFFFSPPFSFYFLTGNNKQEMITSHSMSLSVITVIYFSCLLRRCYLTLIHLPLGLNRNAIRRECGSNYSVLLIVNKMAINNPLECK